MLHTVEKVLVLHNIYVKSPSTDLLMLNILSIFLIPSQCRISGIRA